MLSESTMKQGLRLVCCEVGGESYVLDMSAVRSIQRTDLLQRNPGKEGPMGWLLGARTELPVYAVSSLLGRPSQADPSTARVIVIDRQPEPWGLLVDRVSRVVAATSYDVFPLPASSHNPSAGFFKGLVKLGDRLMLYLSPERLHPDAPPLEDTQTVRLPVTQKKLRAENQDAKKRMLMFSTGSRDRNGNPVVFGLSLNQVLQIMDAVRPVPVPSAPLYSVGVIQWRDCTLPVVDLDDRVGLASSGIVQDRILVARAPEMSSLVGLLIRPNVSLQTLPIAHRSCRRSAGIDRRFTRGIYSLEDRTLVIPDLDAILALNEFEPPADPNRAGFRSGLVS